MYRVCRRRGVLPDLLRAAQSSTSVTLRGDAVVARMRPNDNGEYADSGWPVQDMNPQYHYQSPYPPLPPGYTYPLPGAAPYAPLNTNQFPRAMPILAHFPLPRPSTSGSLNVSRNYHSSTTLSHQQQQQQSSLPIRQRSPSRSSQSMISVDMGKSRKASYKPPRSALVATLPASGVPKPSAGYNQTASIPYQILPQPQHLLVIIDLNGTLIHRPSKASPTKFTSRPHTSRFLNYCINTFTVVIWSSARPENVRAMCAQILPAELRASVIAIWGRDKFPLTPAEYNNKVLCYKRLSTVWNDKTIKESHPEAKHGHTWNQMNTVLIDDSLYKGTSEPFNLIQIPEFSGNEERTEGVLPQVHDYLNRLSMCSNVSNYLKQYPFKCQAIEA